MLTADGEEHPADVLIYGTGFHASEFVAPMKVYGSGGVELSEEWDGDAQAYLGMTVPGFPNLFLLYGPNTNLVINGSILIMVECQVRYAVEAIGQLLRSGHRTMSCRRDVHERYGRDMEEGNAHMVWGVADVPTWYHNTQAGGSRRTGLTTCTRTGTAPGSPTWPTTSWAERGAQQGADRDPRARPGRLRRPGRRLPGRADNDGAVPRSPAARARRRDRG